MFRMFRVNQQLFQDLAERVKQLESILLDVLPLLEAMVRDEQFNTVGIYKRVMHDRHC